MPPRHFYAIDLLQPIPDPSNLPEGFSFYAPTSDDRQKLAQLMLAAYSGTIDDDGGIMDDAVLEVDNFFAGEYGIPLLDSCYVAVDSEGEFASAVLISRWGRQDLPLVAFVMTDPAKQGKGLGLALVRRAVASLKTAGERALRAVITEGNLPSEHLFRSAGFHKIETT